MSLDLNNENINIDGQVDIEDISEDEKVTDEELEEAINEVNDEIDEEIEEIFNAVLNSDDSEGDEEYLAIFGTDDLDERARLFNKYNPDSTIKFEVEKNEEE